MGASLENGADLPGKSSREKSFRWNEGNLDENEKLKALLNPVKIHEPKTPYHGPLDEDDEVDLDEVSPLVLEAEPEPAQQHSTAGSTGNASASSDLCPADTRNGSITFSREDVLSDPGAPNTSNKRQRFEAHRKEHYKMRDAIKLGKELLSHDSSEVLSKPGMLRPPDQR